MSDNSVSTSMTCAALLIIALSVIGGRANAEELTIWNGIDGQGSLTVTTDDYGSFGTGLGWPDLYDFGPDVDPPGERPFTFATTLFVFVDPSEIGQGTHRGVLSTHPLLLNLYSNANVFGEVTSPNTLIDARTTASGYSVLGDGMDLRWTLRQEVSVGLTSPGGPSARLEQTYVITNHGDETLEFIVVKHLDEDLPGDGGGPFHLFDFVGVDFSEFGRPQVYAQDRELPLGAIVLRTREDMTLNPRTVDFVYYVGKQNAPTPPGNPAYPGGECPPHDYGLDTEIWDNYGVPNCWKNFVAGVGYNVPGTSPLPIDGDGFIGLQVEAALPPGETYEVTFVTSYGARPIVDVQIPPALSTQTIGYDSTTGCGEFLWKLKNRNPLVAGKDPASITEFYIDVEAGDGGNACATMTPPQGWTVTLCEGVDGNGHALYRFSGGDPIPIGGKVIGRLEVDTNGLVESTNPLTQIAVPPLSVVLHGAQDQEDAECNFNFGPTVHGDWGIRTIATAFLPVPSADARSRIALALLFSTGGIMLLLGPARSNRIQTQLQPRR